MFEKLLSGMFLGEAARRIILRFAAQTGLLRGQSGGIIQPAASRVLLRLAQPGCFTTAHLAACVDDHTP
jgi:hexokinase